MSFVEYMISHTEYNNISCLFGITRTILWWLVCIAYYLCSAFETLYNSVFSLVGVIYSPQVVSFIQGWISNFLWIPITVSLIVLGYNMIASDDGLQKNFTIKKFIQNILLLILILVGLPMLFNGANNGTSAAFVDTNQNGRYAKGQWNGTSSGLSDILTEKDKNGDTTLISLNKTFAGNSGASYSSSIIADNMVDLFTVYKDVSSNYSSLSFTSSFAEDYIDCDSPTIRKNEFIGGNENSILTVDYNEVVHIEDVADGTDIANSSQLIEDLVVDGYDIGIATDNINNTTDYSAYVSSSGKPTANFSSLKGHEYFFKMQHSYYVKENSQGNKAYIMVNNKGQTNGFMDWDFMSNYPFRYYFDWGVILIMLLTTCVVLLAASLKVVTIIYNITVNQLFAVFFGAADLSNGQKAKEILKSIFSYLLTLLFVTILIQFYFVICSYINSSSFPVGNKFIRAVIVFFVGIAAIKGPDVLERVLGVSSGLGREMGTIMGGAFMAAKAAKGAARTVKKTFGAASKMGARGAAYASGRRAARAEAAGGTGGRGAGAGTAGAGGSGRNNGTNSSSFKPKQTKKQARNSAYENREPNVHSKETPGGQNKAENAFKNQEDNIKQNLDKASKGNAKNIDEKRYDIANDNKDNILNDALSRQQTDSTLTDKEALENAYEASGFSQEESSRLANSVIEDNSFSNKKEDFENSISQSAEEKYASEPMKYEDKTEAYKEAAKEHYEALGMNEQVAKQKGDAFGKELYAEDNQSRIRKEALNLQNESRRDSEATHRRAQEIMDSHKNSSTPMTYSEALNTAVTERGDRGVSAPLTDKEAVSKVLSSDKYGFGGNTENINRATDRILNAGSLQSGIKEGRIAENRQRERVMTNSRNQNLQSRSLGDNALTGVVLGYMSARELKGSTAAGYNHEIKKMEKKTNSGRNSRNKKN